MCFCVLWVSETMHTQFVCPSCKLLSQSCLLVLLLLQYLPSALRSSGKRQLDCLGIATAVLAMCHAIANLEPPQHADLAHCQMTVSDDHCWISLPRQTDLTGAAGDEPRLHVEVTDPR